VRHRLAGGRRGVYWDDSGRGERAAGAAVTAKRGLAWDRHRLEGSRVDDVAQVGVREDRLRGCGRSGCTMCRGSSWRP
jgi:hypothetical protein